MAEAIRLIHPQPNKIAERKPLSYSSSVLHTDRHTPWPPYILTIGNERRTMMATRSGLEFESSRGQECLCGVPHETSEVGDRNATPFFVAFHAVTSGQW
jgi:hypothetical protein